MRASPRLSRLPIKRFLGTLALHFVALCSSRAATLYWDTDAAAGLQSGGGGYGLYEDVTTPDLVKQRLPTAQMQAAGIASVGGLTGGTGASVQLPFGSMLSVVNGGTNTFAGAVIRPRNIEFPQLRRPVGNLPRRDASAGLYKPM